MTYFTGAIIAIAVAISLALPLLRRRATSSHDADTDDTLQDMMAERDSLYAAIKELEFDLNAGKLSPKDYAEMRRTYEAKAVEVLKKIDTASPGLKTEKVETAPSRPRPLTRGEYVALIAVAVATISFSGYYLSSYMKSRPEFTERAQSREEMIARLERRVNKNPTDLKALLALARANLEEQRIQGAVQIYRRVLSLDDSNPEALSNLGVVLIGLGHYDPALQMVDRALSKNPVYPTALWAKGLILFHGKQEYRGAIQAWEKYIQVNAAGGDTMVVQGWVDEAKRRLAAPSAGKEQAPTKPEEMPAHPGMKMP